MPPGQHSLWFLKTIQSASLADYGRSPRVDSDVTICDATAVARAPLTKDGVFRAGDASLALDPLSGQGFQRAITSGVQTAIVLHTILVREKSAALARDFYLNSHREAVRGHVTACSAFYRAQDRFDSAFWRERSQREGFAERPPTKRPILGHCMDEELFISPHASWKQLPVIEGQFVECRAALMHPLLHRPIAFLEGQLLSNLLRPFVEGCTGSTALETWSGSMSPAARDRALRFLLGQDILLRRAPGIPSKSPQPTRPNLGS
jgi:hypothetical protein